MPVFTLRVLIAIFSLFLISCASSSPRVTSGDLFSDKTYTLDLDLIAALDPRPLAIREFSPDPEPRVRGLRISSRGRIFPVDYEVISAPQIPGKAKLLSDISKALDGHADIVAKERGRNDTLGDHIHYFQRVSIDGKPHHVSSNYLFIVNDVFYHLAATSYAPTVMPRESWGQPGPDGNAEREVQLLIQAFRAK